MNARTSVKATRAGFRAAALAMGVIALAALTRQFIPDFTVGTNFVPTFVQSLFSETALHGLVLLFALLAAAPYLSTILPHKMNWFIAVGCLVAGLLYGALVNIPVHLLTQQLLSLPPAEVFEHPQTSASAILAIVIGTVFVAPIVEEFVCRGMLFYECNDIPRWQVAAWSTLVFCTAHVMVGGTAKIVSVIPISLVLVLIRIRFQSWVYSACAHMGTNLVSSSGAILFLLGLNRGFQ